MSLTQELNQSPNIPNLCVNPLQNGQKKPTVTPAHILLLVLPCTSLHEHITTFSLFNKIINNIIPQNQHKNKCL